jgi:hypothetical protein
MRLRHARFRRLPASIRLPGWSRSLIRPRGWMAGAGVAAVLVLTLVGVSVAGVSSASPAPPKTATPAAQPTRSAASSPAEARRHAQTAARSGVLRTSCRSVAHIGDSTSLDLITPQYLPDAAQQLPAQYTDVGVRHLHMDASGGRSIVEELPGQLNGYIVAQNWWNEGFRGCWVFALGTNDAANVAVGDTPGFMTRIERMMSVAHGEPVLWVNTRTMLSSGPWAEANEQAWDNDLVRALAMYPNMRILNWAALAQPGWFLPDGIHYNSVGCAVRAEAIAHGLARAFPQYGYSHSQIVY